MMPGGSLNQSVSRRNALKFLSGIDRHKMCDMNITAVALVSSASSTMASMRDLVEIHSLRGCGVPM